MTETALPALIQQMLQPGFYPHPVIEPIQLVQTHVSYILLTGEFAYKVKKSVNFGFLDFSTLEKREHFCHEEIRLNQRGAAELYLDVLPIMQTGDRYQLNGTGDPVEFAVKMQQFPAGTLFSDLFEQGQLTENLLLRLAKELAAFHRKGAINDYIRSFGEVEQIRQAFDENYDQTLGYIGGPQTQTQFDETRQYSDRLFAEKADLFTQRIQHDWIRECHGDVHLRNIALWNDKILLFDCIEFNEPFRFVDTMFDIAYIIMDLDARNRPDLSNVFLNAYIEQMGDWEGLQVLPLYLSRQSYVRAKVTSFLLGDPSIPAAVKQECQETAARYYRLAWEYTRSPLGTASEAHAGTVYMMAGLSGSGKSTIARTLARHIGAVHLRSDAVRKHLAGIPLDQPGNEELYTPEMSQKTYDRLLQLGLTLATQGYPVILDAKYDRQSLRQSVIEAVTETHPSLKLQILHCDAPLEVRQEWITQRQGDISDATVELLPKQAMEPLTEAERPYVTTIDSTQDLEAQLRELISP
ncbi:MAG: AAA family ATPase [Leptolyngbyaceae cyanobacterium bins.349]|nr:AAA family ATPase [Leptolyngbyaceae cyanobacterium bins.349]